VTTLSDVGDLIGAFATCGSAGLADESCSDVAPFDLVVSADSGVTAIGLSAESVGTGGDKSLIFWRLRGVSCFGGLLSVPVCSPFDVRIESVMDLDGFESVATGLRLVTLS
jgi:hypothetical protein